MAEPIPAMLFVPTCLADRCVRRQDLTNRARFLDEFSLRHWKKVPAVKNLFHGNDTHRADKYVLLSLAGMELGQQNPQPSLITERPRFARRGGLSIPLWGVDVCHVASRLDPPRHYLPTVVYSCRIRKKLSLTIEGGPPADATMGPHCRGGVSPTGHIFQNTLP